MLKFILGFLLLANLAAAAYNAGYLGTPGRDGHEPARMTNQLHAPAIRLVNPPSLGASLAPAAAQRASRQVAPDEGPADAVAVPRLRAGLPAR